MPEKKPTIRTLAALAGVSPAAVSLALRNSPRIGRATIDKIHRLAEETGYKGSPVVSRLLSEFRSRRRDSRRGSLAIIHTSREPGDHKSPTLREWAAAAKERAAGAEFDCDEFSLHTGGTSPARMASILRARGTAGLLLTGPFPDGRIPARIRNLISKIPAVVMGERPKLPALSCALNDQFATARHATAMLLELGYKRPGLCVHPDIDELLERRFRGGFLAAMSESGPIFQFHPKSQREFLTWFRRHKPDAVLTIHTEIRDWLESSGIHCPEDVGLAHLDLSRNTRVWSGVRQDNSHLGGAAVDLLLAQIHFNICGTPPVQQCLVLGSEWVGGKTTRKVNC